MEERNIGVTLIFKKKNVKKISGILKSIVVKSSQKNIKKEIEKKVNEISDFYNYIYLGVSDVFFVSGDIQEREILGRTTYYDLDTIKKAKSLISKELLDNEHEKEQTLNYSLIYFCKNLNEESFTIVVVTILNSFGDSLIKTGELIGNDVSFIQKIKDNSVEKINSAKFIGINDIGETDLDFNVIQTFYADFKSMKSLEMEIISDKEMELKLDDIIK